MMNPMQNPKERCSPSLSTSAPSLMMPGMYSNGLSIPMMGFTPLSMSMTSSGVPIPMSSISLSTAPNSFPLHGPYHPTPTVMAAPPVYPPNSSGLFYSAPSEASLSVSSTSTAFSPQATLPQDQYYSHSVGFPTTTNSTSSYSFASTPQDALVAHSSTTLLDNIEGSASQIEETAEMLSSFIIRCGSDKASKTCTHCGKKFTNTSDRKRHERTHTGEQPFSCPMTYCDKRFTQRGSVIRHVKVHLDQKDFPCSFDCGKSFRTKNAQRRHERQHTNVKPYECPEKLCFKRFASSSALKYHSKVHRTLDTPK